MVTEVVVLVNLVFLIIALGFLVPSGVLFIECLSAILSSPFREEKREQQPTKVAVVVPAHNEASKIKNTLETLLPQLTFQDRLLVIADNCTDETAAIARQCGAIVIERQNSQQQGKGYALDYGLQFLEADPPEVVCLVDADCTVKENTIAKIAQLAKTANKPVQATYLIEPSAYQGTKDIISTLAIRIKNLVRPYGLARLGLPCLLTGSGMAFPWQLIRQASLASGNIVEDMQLGIDLTLAGYSPIFCLEAKVLSILPSREETAITQRKRWEHGHLQTLLTQVPRLLKASVVKRRFDLFALALELCVPPLSLLLMLWTVALGGALLTGILTKVWIGSLILAVAGLLIFISVLGAWVKFCRADIPGLALLTIPLYLFWKVPLYFAFLIKPETKWIRTRRDTENF
ncbi:glycosyltransferase family 2 protein [Pleurocapsales cyanobacterium LEGE 06147]|nr:glycosyltransferase family 2 protein [Pleurocapsales cyanobacterium LEGE 06147]